MRHIFVEYVEMEILGKFYDSFTNQKKGKRKYSASKYRIRYNLVLNNCLHVGSVETINVLVYFSDSVMFMYYNGASVEWLMMFTYGRRAL